MDRVGAEGGSVVDERRMERIGLATGLGLALVLVVRTLITPSVPPSAGSTPEEFASFFTDNQSVWLWTVWLTGLVLVLGTLFFGSVRAVIARAEGAPARAANIFFAAWIAQGTVAASRHAIMALPAVSKGADPLLGYTLLGIGAFMLGMVWFLFLLQTVALALIILRMRVLPAWMGWFSWLAAVVAFLGTLMIVQLTGPLSAGGGFRWVVLGTYIAWVALLSLASLMSSGSSASD